MSRLFPGFLLEAFGGEGGHHLGTEGRDCVKTAFFAMVVPTRVTISSGDLR